MQGLIECFPHAWPAPGAQEWRRMIHEMDCDPTKIPYSNGTKATSRRGAEGTGNPLKTPFLDVL